MAAIMVCSFQAAGTETDMVSERRWQIRLEDTWLDIAGLSERHILTASGQGVVWRGDSWLPLAMLAGRLRYTVLIGDQWMVWRSGGMPLLAMDFGRSDLTALIRQAQVEARQNKQRRE
jgi:hypothetical protein